MLMVKVMDGVGMPDSAADNPSETFTLTTNVRRVKFTRLGPDGMAAVVIELVDEHYNNDSYGLTPGQSVYVMNEHGKTIDSFRA